MIASWQRQGNAKIADTSPVPIQPSKLSARSRWRSGTTGSGGLPQCAMRQRESSAADRRPSLTDDAACIRILNHKDLGLSQLGSAPTQVSEGVEGQQALLARGPASRHRLVGKSVPSSAVKIQQSPQLLTRCLSAFIAVAAVYIVGIRLQIAAGASLWMDETWSAMIATRPNWSEFWHEAWLDCNPPLYYFFLKGWVAVFGDSNLMLRLPSILFCSLAAALPLVWPPHGLNQTARWTWAGLILLWPPSILMMVDARGYALMLLLSTASCLVVAKMLDRLSIKWAIAWVTLGTLMFLTHYFAAVLIAAQILVLLYRHRAQLFQVWSATLVAIPGIAWFAYHLPRLKDYARPDVAWQPLTNAGSALEHLSYVLGGWNSVSPLVIAAILGIAALHRWRTSSGQIIAPVTVDRDLALTASTAVIGFAIAIGIGILQASLINRYLVPLVPPTMLGFALIIQGSIQQELNGLLLLFFFTIPGLNANQTRQYADIRALYGYEQGSNFVGHYNPEQLLFLWDHPAAKILDQKSLELVGGYFLKRNNINVPTRALVVPETADANSILRAAAGGKRTAVIWLYNTSDRTAARAHRPTLENDPAWACLDRGPVGARIDQLGAIACVNQEKAGD